MSNLQIDRSSDLKRLQDEGYNIEIREGHLLVKDVPYVNEKKEVKRGVLISTLNVNNDVTQPPETHVVFFIGDYPCNMDGSKITQIQHGNNQTLGLSIVANYSFSNKPASFATGYPNYYHKMATYAKILSSPALALDQDASPTTPPATEYNPEKSVFCYGDSASVRAGIVAVTAKLANQTVAIVGLGGTGSYVLDLIAKTPVREIHLFDSDNFLQHNAFRAPGAASNDDFEPKQKKVDYYTNIYSRMRKCIVPHPQNIDASNIDELKGADTVFLCIDGGPSKRIIVDSLQALSIQFIDCGIGVNIVDKNLIGKVRVTTCTTNKKDHVQKYVSFVDPDEGINDYSRNIQIADLNALTATLAVIKWKKLCGFYADLEQEHQMNYTVSMNVIINGECQ